jgi:uncharacterized membrane protein HdeD (DUF308 family)
LQALTGGIPIPFVILAHNWWMLLLRGVLAFVFGLVCFAYPGVTPMLLVIVFGSYTLIDGLVAIAAAITRAQGQQRWWSTLIEGLVGSMIGLLILIWPGITALGLLYLIATWAVLTGVFKIVAAIRLRRHIIGEWLLLLSGAASVVCGLLLFFMPGSGVLAVLFWIGAYAVTIGLFLVVVALRLRRWVAQPTEQLST